MKNAMVKVFRDIPSSVLLMVGFGLTIFIAMVCCGLVNDIINSQDIINNENVNYYYMDMYNPSGDTERVGFDEIYGIMEKYSLDFYIHDFVHIGEGQEEQKRADLIYSFDGIVPFSLKNGYLDQEGDKSTVIIGESLKPFVTKRDNGDYLYVGGVYYKVTGVVENKGFGGYDSSVYFIQKSNDGSLHNLVKKAADEISGGASKEFTIYGKGSETEDNMYKAKAELENNYLLQVGIGSEPSDDMTESKAVNFFYENLNKVFMPLLFLFSIGSCYSITSLWVKVRKTDIAIRVTYGFGRLKLYKWIMGEIGILLGISLAATVLVWIIYMAASGELHTLKDNIIYDILIMAGAMAITLSITSLGAYKYSKSIIPAVALKEL